MFSNPFKGILDRHLVGVGQHVECKSDVLMLSHEGLLLTYKRVRISIYWEHTIIIVNVQCLYYYCYATGGEK